MSKGSFDEAAKVLNFGKEALEKSGIASREYYTILVNLITCYRNIGRDDEIRNNEEKLRKNDPKNAYFDRLNTFEDNFSKAF